MPRRKALAPARVQVDAGALREARARSGLSLEAVALATGLGVRTVARIEATGIGFRRNLDAITRVTGAAAGTTISVARRPGGPSDPTLDAVLTIAFSDHAGVAWQVRPGAVTVTAPDPETARRAADVVRAVLAGLYRVTRWHEVAADLMAPDC